MKKVRLAAHRGYSSDYPENTMAAFVAAAETDIDMIETDVHLTADDKLILIHDDDLSRTTDMRGDVNMMKYADILRADAGYKTHEKFRGERVPLLTDLLDLIKSRNLEINIEIKDYPRERGVRAYECCDRIIAAVEARGLADSIYINSFSYEVHEYIDEKYGHKYRLHGYYPPFLLKKGMTDDEYKRLFCVCMFNDYKEGDKVLHHENPLCDRAEFDKFTAMGIEPWVCFSKDEDVLLPRAIEYGALGVTTNNPVSTAAILKNCGAR